MHYISSYNILMSNFNFDVNMSQPIQNSALSTYSFGSSTIGQTNHYGLSPTDSYYIDKITGANNKIKSLINECTEFNSKCLSSDFKNEMNKLREIINSPLVNNIDKERVIIEKLSSYVNKAN